MSEMIVYHVYYVKRKKKGRKQISAQIPYISTREPGFLTCDRGYYTCE